MNAMQRLILEHPANAQLLATWCSDAPFVSDVIGDTWQLGTHPDLVEHFYAAGQAGAEDGVNVKWVVCGRPGLVNPNTGIIYGLATGTSGVWLRLNNEGNEPEFVPGWLSVDPWNKEFAVQCLEAFLATET